MLNCSIRPSVSIYISDGHSEPKTDLAPVDACFFADVDESTVVIAIQFVSALLISNVADVSQTKASRLSK